jgi:hypothetical protein
MWVLLPVVEDGLDLDINRADGRLFLQPKIDPSPL